MKVKEINIDALAGILSDLQDEVADLKSKLNCKIEPPSDIFSEKRIISKQEDNLIDEKVSKCREIIFNLDSLKLDFEKELFHVRFDGIGYSDYEYHRLGVEDLHDLIKEFHDEEDED